MNLITTRRYHIRTNARPDQAWAALTRPELTARYLYGLRLDSHWRPGDLVTAVADGHELAGEVLAAEEGRRLSYLLGPATYVTWEIDAATATVVLTVDEIDDDGDGEWVWGQAARGFGAVLDAARTY